MRPLLLCLLAVAVLVFGVPALADVSVNVAEPAVVAVAETPTATAVAVATPKTSCHGSRKSARKEARYQRYLGRENARAVRSGASVATATAVSR
jgi:hypothetical protein